jgi:hypothetical protein
MIILITYMVCFGIPNGNIGEKCLILILQVTRKVISFRSIRKLGPIFVAIFVSFLMGAIARVVDPDPGARK